MVPARYRIADRVVETRDTVTIDLVPCDEPITEAEPGQFLMLYAFGVGETAISVSGCPGDEGRLRHTIRAAGAGTRALCALPTGSMVGVRGPFGNGWPWPSVDGHDVLVVAGGIGFAPLRPIVRRLLAERSRFGRVAVMVGARTPTDLVHRAELDEWWRRSNVEVAVTVDAADRAWRGEVGVVNTLLGRVSFTPDRAVAFVCGPEVMMRVVARDLVDLGVRADRIFVSLERNMHCAIGQCGHCQLGPLFVCADGPVVSWMRAAPLLAVRRW
jgi:anaerobic sulfite reductase subunit B